MKRKSFVLSLLALVLILAAAINPALAYFTANDRADGAVPLTLGSKTVIREYVHDLTKEVTIANTEGDPVWVRAIAYSGVTYPLSVDGWGVSGVGSGVWVYYPEPVYAGETTTALSVEVTDIPDTGEFYVPSFNVSVQYESIPVLFDEDGDPIWPISAEYNYWDGNENKLTGFTYPGGGNP